MNRKQALARLEQITNSGFSIATIKDFVNEIYNSIESKGVQANAGSFGTVFPGIEKRSPDNLSHTRESVKSIPSDKQPVKFNQELLSEILNREGVELADWLSETKLMINHKEYGKLYYYPKSDKIHVTKSNDWKNFGFNWMYRILR